MSFHHDNTVGSIFYSERLKIYITVVSIVAGDWYGHAPLVVVRPYAERGRQRTMSWKHFSKEYSLVSPTTVVDAIESQRTARGWR